MAARAFLLSLPLILLLAIEAAYRFGAWEAAAAPGSHSGQAIAMKRLWIGHEHPIDVVTLGSSRAVYGLDHAMLAGEARRHGRVHATFALAGSHWMSVRGISRWLETHRPEVKRRVIALSIADFQFAGNGPYELAIVEPLRGWTDARWISRHVPFDLHDVATYGVYSSLMEYRGDMAQAIRNPRQRWHQLRADREFPAIKILEGAGDDRDLCAVDVSTLGRCVATALAPGAQSLREQCSAVRASRPVDRRLLVAGPGGGPHPAILDGRNMIVSELRETRWRGHTMVVLLPIHHTWLQEVVTEDLHQWVLSMLRPLVDEGTITLLDYTGHFDHDARSDCGAFFDLYHQNTASAKELTHTLIGQSASWLYDDP
jgi:hypothetical protein